MQVYLNNKQNKINIDKREWKKVAVKLGKLLDLSKNTEVSITFVDDQEIQELNKNYRDIDKPTDVLSFPADNSFNLPVRVLGDIIISLEKAVSQGRYR